VRRTTIVTALLAAMAFAAVPAGAKGTRHHSPCAKVREELAAGKSVEEVAKEMKLKESTVKKCQASASKSESQASQKK